MYWPRFFNSGFMGSQNSVRKIIADCGGQLQIVLSDFFADVLHSPLEFMVTLAEVRLVLVRLPVRQPSGFTFSAAS